MKEEKLNVNGIPMRWEEQGDGRPVVFIHGIPTSPSVWRHVVPLVENARCLAWEMVGYGGSLAEGEGRDLSISKQADYLIEWLDAAGIGRAVLVGHDLGGGVAQIAAVRHPSRVTGLVLINSICYDSWPIPSVRMLQSLAPVVSVLPNPFIFLILGTLMIRGHDDLNRAGESLPLHWKHYSETNVSRALVRQIQALDVKDTLAVAEDLPKMQIPTRIVWGAADVFQKVSYGETLATDLTAPIDRIEGGKHFVPEDHPDRVAAAVEEVVREIAVPMTTSARSGR